MLLHTHSRVRCVCGAPCVPAPSCSYPKVTETLDNSVHADMMVVWPAVVHVALLDGASPAPSVQQVINATEVQGYLGGGTIECVDASAVYPLAFQGLDPGTTYDAYFALESFATPPVPSASVTKLSMTTTGGTRWDDVASGRVAAGERGMGTGPVVCTACGSHHAAPARRALAHAPERCACCCCHTPHITPQQLPPPLPSAQGTRRLLTSPAPRRRWTCR